jgi:hypothetical protein
VTVSDSALPWVLFVGCVLGGVIGGLLAAFIDRYAQFGRDWLAGRLSGLPILVAPYGCDDCPAGVDQPHRYAGCPGNVRQHERELNQ